MNGVEVVEKLRAAKGTLLHQQQQQQQQGSVSNSNNNENASGENGEGRRLQVHRPIRNFRLYVRYEEISTHHLPSLYIKILIVPEFVYTELIIVLK